MSQHFVRKFQIPNFRFQIWLKLSILAGELLHFYHQINLKKFLNSIHKNFSIAPKIEFTLEMNPATVTLEKLQDFKNLGVNRASFGVQTFDDRALKLLARGHTADDARKTFEILRQANFDNISFDLIAGSP